MWQALPMPMVDHQIMADTMHRLYLMLEQAQALRLRLDLALSPLFMGNTETLNHIGILPTLVCLPTLVSLLCQQRFLHQKFRLP